MGDAAIMQELERICDIARHQRRLLFSEASATLNVVQQRTTAHLLEDHVEAAFVLKPLKEGCPLRVRHHSIQ